MSSVKYRLRKLLPSLAEQSKGCRDRKVKKRLYLIKAIVSSRRSLKAACEFRGVTREQFYEWSRRLLAGGEISSLAPRSRRPHKSPNQTKPAIEKKILEIKNKMPFLGPERIANRLEELYVSQVSPSTIYAVLKRNKAISKEYRARRTKKHTRRYRRPIPGFLQMDFKYVPYLIDDKQYYQLSAVDHCTSWRLIRAYPRKDEQSVMEFLRELELRCPFPIFQIQTDNDAAFTDKYTVGLGARPTGAHPVDEWCRSYGCRHKLIPIAEKEINGKVENTHKYDDEEFYSQRRYPSLESLQAAVQKYNHDWNENRRTKTLGWRSPGELLEEINATILTLLLFCRVEDPEPQPVQAVVLEKSQSPAKPQSPLDRYLAWMAWDAAQYPKLTLLTVSGMSLSYSICNHSGRCEAKPKQSRRHSSDNE